MTSPEGSAHPADQVRAITEAMEHVAELVAGTSPLTDVPLHYLLDKATGPQPVADQR